MSSVYLAVTPSDLSGCQSLRTPLCHIAYAVGDGGQLMGRGLPRGIQGGLMGLSDRCAGSLPEPHALCQSILNVCAARRFGGVLADFEREAEPSRLAFLSRLGATLRQTGKRLFVPEAFAVPEAFVLIGTALSGGTLRERLSDAAARYGAQRIALDCQRLAVDITLPCRSGDGTPLTREELAALRERSGSAVFFSDELCANYFSYFDRAQAHFVLFDTAETLRRKVQLGRERGIGDAFFMFPEVDDLLPGLLTF